MGELLELAERVEALTEASREVDVDIWEAVAPKLFARALNQVSGCMARGSTAEQARAAMQKRGMPYTHSLDAAMTLVPEGWRLQLGEVELGHSTGVYVWHAVLRTQHHGQGTHGATPALALTAACLRARATLAEGADRHG